MRRRTFIAGLGSAAARPVVARAQQDDRVRRIGVLMQGDENDSLPKARISAFTQALADLGWKDGRNVMMNVRWYGIDFNRIRALAQELVDLQPDVIVTGSTPATAAVQRETRTIPIVFVTGGDPVASGIVGGSIDQAGTSQVSPSTKARWGASGLSCSRRSRRDSTGRQWCSILTSIPYRIL
jgi:putative ABC transport system substrate-binding protein